jgi:hypothetical protein
VLERRLGTIGVMKILASNNSLNRMALCVFLLSTLSIARGAGQAVPVPASPESFDMDTSKTASVGGAVQFGEFLGRRAIDLPAGLLYGRMRSMHSFIAAVSPWIAIISAFRTTGSA